jgi:hypothetical protein
LPTAQKNIAHYPHNAIHCSDTEALSVPIRFYQIMTASLRGQPQQLLPCILCTETSLFMLVRFPACKPMPMMTGKASFRSLVLCVGGWSPTSFPSRHDKPTLFWEGHYDAMPPQSPRWTTMIDGKVLFGRRNSDFPTSRREITNYAGPTCCDAHQPLSSRKSGIASDYYHANLPGAASRPEILERY